MRAITPSELSHFRREVHPSTLVYQSDDLNFAAPLDQVDRLHRPHGMFTLAIISAWLANSTGMYLAPVSSCPTHSPLLQHIADLFHQGTCTSHTFMCSAVTTSCSHMFAIRRYHNTWYLLDSMLDGPVVLHDRMCFPGAGTVHFLAPRRIPVGPSDLGSYRLRVTTIVDAPHHPSTQSSPSAHPAPVLPSSSAPPPPVTCPGATAPPAAHPAALLMPLPVHCPAPQPLLQHPRALYALAVTGNAGNGPTKGTVLICPPYPMGPSPFLRDRR
jgi:hypothetical protein